MTVARFAVLAVLFSGCTGEKPAPQPPAALAASTDTAHPWRKPGDKIDSILPMPEYLRRFRQGLTEPTGLSGGGSSLDDVARRFLSAVTRRDTAALSELAVTRAEFAWLVFPLHKYHNPPYELDPAIFWLQITAGSSKGLHRTLERLGGAALSMVGFGCVRDTLQVASPALRIWSGCSLRYRAGGQLKSGALFGSVVERDGRFKLLSFANDF